MKYQHFTIDGKLPGLNDIVRAARSHWSKGAQQKKLWTHGCAMYAVKLKPIESSCKLEFSWFEPDRRRDIDNVSAGAKFVIDGMVEAGKLPNDDRRWVKQIVHHFPDPDKENPRIEIQITELG